MHTCMFHGKYKGNYCPECETNFEKKFEDHSSFMIFFLKGVILMSIGIGAGWLLFSM